ncbi:MAG TPA: protein kinase, partial [Anaerolineae bacterium]|nr:protein kinase [Anaerolineae bacterium]
MSDDITPNQDEVPNSDGFPKKLGRYKIERLIGEGSFAHVYLAQDHLRPVALKVLKRKYVVDEAFVKRFLAEARTSVRLENEHIIRIYDQEVIDNFHFIAMEYAKGGDLAQYLQQQEKK